MATPKLVAEAERLGILPKTEYKRDHYIFPREQSQVSKLCDWEDRCARPEPWWKVIAGGFGYILFCIAMFMLANALKGI
jgi:hypothetical protein